MEMLDMKVTNGSNLTATLGPDAVELIIFAAFSWSSIVFITILFITMLLFPFVRRMMAIDAIWKRLFVIGKWKIFLTVFGIGVIAVTVTVLLVVGSVLSTSNGDSTGLSAENIIGRVLLILTDVILLLVSVLMVAICALSLYRNATDFRTKCAAAWITVLGCVIGTLFVTGVVLLGLSSFGFDTIQESGSNSTVTPGLLTAGVPISGFAFGVLPLVILFPILYCYYMCIKEQFYELRRQQAKEARLKKSKSLLEEALKFGFVECRTVVCLLVGVAGAGKTHTKHLLFRWAPPEFRDSTPLAVRPVQAIRVRASTQGGQLQEVDPDQLDNILAGTVAKGGVPLERFQGLFCCKCKCFYHQTTSAGITASPHWYGAIESPSSESTSHKRKCCCCHPIAHSNDSDSEQIASSMLNKTVCQIANTFQSQQLLSGDWIYLIDSGGQIEFLEVLPAFLQHISVCLFVTKLSEMLSEHPKIEYFENGEQVGEPPLCPFTNEQMLMRCVQTINDSSTNQDSKLVMVGTHQDLADQCSESTEEKNQRIQNKLCPQFDRSLVFRGQEIIFPINAKNPGPHDHEVASAITKEIFNVVSNLEPRRTPISWFKFEQLIRKLARDHGKKILHWKVCFKVARLLHLSRQDLAAALVHLASFGVIHYYPHLLPEVVFVDPQFILDKISQVVKFHYKLRYDQCSHTAIRGERRKFINEACITLELLKQFPEHYTTFFSANDFLKLMKDRLIVTDLIGNDEYFMPCLLRTMEPQEIDQHRASRVVPLAIHFNSCQLVPHGVFCSLVAFLQSSQNSTPWRLSPCPEDRSAPLCLARNCIKFQFPGGEPGSLTLIDTFTHFEVHVDTPYDDVCDRFCPSIQQTLFKGIQKAAETLGYHQLFPKLAFLCIKCENTHPHLALPADALDYWKCELKPDTVYGKLTDDHLVWCPQKDVGSREEVQLPLETHSEAGGGVTNWKKKIKEMCSCKFVMFIIAILGLVVSIVGIVVPVITTRQGQPHQNSSGIAIPD